MLGNLWTIQLPLTSSLLIDELSYRIIEHFLRFTCIWIQKSDRRLVSHRGSRRYRDQWCDQETQKRGLKYVLVDLNFRFPRPWQVRVAVLVNRQEWAEYIVFGYLGMSFIDFCSKQFRQVSNNYWYRLFSFRLQIIVFIS